MAAARVYLEQGLVTDISLDHDMGACAACTAAGATSARMTRRGNTFYHYCPHVPSGYDLCMWMEETGRWPRGSVRVHSANPAGAERMQAVIARARRGPAPTAFSPDGATRLPGGWRGALPARLGGAWSGPGAEAHLGVKLSTQVRPAHGRPHA